MTSLTYKTCSVCCSLYNIYNTSLTFSISNKSLGFLYTETVFSFYYFPTSANAILST